MAHKEGHRKVTGWLPEVEAEALESLAKRNERSLAAELRLAVRTHLEAYDVATDTTPGSLEAVK